MHIDLIKVIIGVLVWLAAQKSLLMIAEGCIKPNIYKDDPKKRELATMGIEILIIIAIITVIQKMY